jgi:hypothetical protein
MLGGALKVAMAIGLISGAYILCFGMYIAAIWDARGIPGGGVPLNRLVSGLYALGTVMTLVGSVLLTFGLLKSALVSAAA